MGMFQEKCKDIIRKRKFKSHIQEIPKDFDIKKCECDMWKTFEESMIQLHKYFNLKK